MKSSQAPSAGQQTREWARAEYKKATNGLIFTKDFQTRQETLMRDPLATVGERVLAWILRYSWGEFVLYAIREDGQPAGQMDCAKDLKIDKRRVNDAVAYYKKRGYLEDRGKLLYPVISPVLASPPPEEEEKSGEYRTFVEQWKVTHSADFLELEVARSTVKRIRKVLLSEYKKSRHPVENAGPSLLRDKESNTERDHSSSSAVVSLPADPPQKPEEDDRNSSYRQFKTAYPREHFDEPKAKPSFEKKTKTEQASILVRLQVYVTCERWRDEGGRWIPLASNWLETCDADPPPLLKKSKTTAESGIDEERLRRIAANVEESRKWR